MKRTFSLLLIGTMLTSCGVDREKYIEELSVNHNGLKELLSYIETNYSNLTSDENPGNRIVFTDCDGLGYSSEDYVCDAKVVLKKMKKLGISEIRFEKTKDSCEVINGFTEVYFKREKSSFEPVVYYLYEYCGNTDLFESSNIYYKPLDDFWGVYIDTNFP